MSSKVVQKRDQNSVAEPATWSGESREQWVSSAIAAATASLRASVPSSNSMPATPGFNVDPV